jgi:hypothetical protein
MSNQLTRLLKAGALVVLCTGLSPWVMGAERDGSAAVAPAQSSAMLQSLLEQYANAQRVALKEQLCLATVNCVTDEARLLAALETSRRLLHAVAELAEAGDAEAAYQRGLLSLGVVEKHAKRSATQVDLRSSLQKTRLQRLMAVESESAQRYLGMASRTGHALACQALARHLSERALQSEKPLVAKLYLCAVRGFLAQALRAPALQAYASMKRTVAPDSVELVQAYSLMFHGKTPDRPWQRAASEVVNETRKWETP